MQDPELPEDWVAAGWTPETAGKEDAVEVGSWGDVGPQVSPPDPSSFEEENGDG